MERAKVLKFEINYKEVECCMTCAYATDDVKLRLELGMGAYRCAMLTEEQQNNVVWAYCCCDLYDSCAED